VRPASKYLTFVLDAVETLHERQSMALGNSGREPRIIAVTRTPTRGVTVFGAHGGVIRPLKQEPRPVEMEPALLDMDLWPVLERLSDVSGDSQHRERVIRMAEVFADYGFDPRSGLGYLGQEAALDARTYGMRSFRGDIPQFKPGLDLPLERLWEQAPRQMERMFRAAYYGLVTRPETMDYNRHCSYSWYDEPPEPKHKFNANHIAFASTGAFLIRDWTFHFIKTGEERSLAWAQAVADKWRAVQDRETGLIPYEFSNRDISAGDASSLDKEAITPSSYCRSVEISMAVSLLRSAKALQGHGEADELASQIHDMGLRFTKGLARHSYDGDRDVFLQWIAMNGEEHAENMLYYFTTQEQKDEWVRKEPSLEEVPVFPGGGLYRDYPFSPGLNTWSGIPLLIGEAAELTGDPNLIDRADFFARQVMQKAAELSGPFNDDGQWTFPANAAYIKLMLILRRITGQDSYMHRARELADRELGFLSPPAPEGKPEWWRMPFRNILLDAMLEMHAAQGENDGCES